MGEIVEVDSKGRIVIPSSIRNKLGLSEGTTLVVEVKGDEVVLSRILTESPARDKENSLKDFLCD
jgi:AbrB family looped-hinge helix DNA binding protein